MPQSAKNREQVTKWVRIVSGTKLVCEHNVGSWVDRRRVQRVRLSEGFRENLQPFHVQEVVDGEPEAGAFARVRQVVVADDLVDFLRDVLDEAFLLVELGVVGAISRPGKR